MAREMSKIGAIVALATVLGAGSASAMSGGTAVTDPRQAPWMANIALKGTPLPQGVSCGGALVAPTKVLTAAHCLPDVPIAELRALAEYHIGATTLSRQPGHTAQIAAVAIDPGYALLPSPSDPDNPAASSATHDLAVVTLDHPVPGVTPLPIADHDPRPLTAATLYGHGITSPTSGTSDALNKGTYLTLPDVWCAPATPAQVDPSSMRCGAGLGVEACEGDSGGPLVADGALVGVFSFGMETAAKPCGGPGPNFFTSVPAARPWLAGQLS